MLSASKMGLTYGPTVALDDVSITVGPGEVVALVGASGSGKTSLLYCMAGLLLPTTGSVSFDGREISALTDEERSDLRCRSFGFVFQFSELVPELSLRENVKLPLALNGAGRREQRRRSEELMDRLGIAALADRRPAQVSGGQAQRAAVARALVHKPAVVFADEPTGALDSAAGGLVLSELLQAAADETAAVVLVTHDLGVAASADRRITMRDGRVVSGG